MGKILILFDSATGHTEKMAHYIEEGVQTINNHEVKVVKVDQATHKDIVWCDGLALGSPTNMGTVSWKMKRFWDEIGNELWGKIDGKIGCAFSSQGGWGGGAELTCLSLLTILMNYGFLVFGIPDYVADRFTLHYGSICAGEPREKREIDSCKLLGRRLAEWISRYVDQKNISIK
jgi:NAD(P)H dehydrogenase (quinone)